MCHLIYLTAIALVKYLYVSGQGTQSRLRSESWRLKPRLEGLPSREVGLRGLDLLDLLDLRDRESAQADFAAA